MLHRTIQDLAPPADTDVDTAAMAASAAVVERAAWHLDVLGEVAQISLALTRSLGELAVARVEAAKAESRALAPDDQATLTAYYKAAQTLRRTVALRDKLDKEATPRREGLLTERAERRATLAAAHEHSVKHAVLEGLHDAWAADCPDTEYMDLVDRMMDDAREYLGDADEMRGWLDRPVGETVSRLCAALGLDPEACEPDGAAWRVRRPPLDFELRIEEKARKYPPSLLPSPSGEGQDAKRPGWGSLAEPTPPSGFADSTAPPDFIDTSPP